MIFGLLVEEDLGFDDGWVPVVPAGKAIEKLLGFGELVVVNQVLHGFDLIGQLGGDVLGQRRCVPLLVKTASTLQFFVLLPLASFVSLGHRGILSTGRASVSHHPYWRVRTRGAEVPRLGNVPSNLATVCCR